MTPDENNIDEVLKHALPSASQEQREAARGRIYNRARMEASAGDDLEEFDSARFGWSRAAQLVAAAALVVIAVWAGLTWNRPTVYSVSETADGSLYRVVGGKRVPVRMGERIEAQEIVRSDGGGGVLKLTDGSSIEMRAKSELSLERADDGIRIHLRNGGLIVKSSKQVAGHLYVQTKDVTVSVVGTVFLVNAEEEGSRVAVIEGEVRVQQGASTKNLLPGQQLSTNPKMEPLPVKEELSWSRDAVAHAALLQQSAVVPPQPRLAFEVASIRPSNPGPPAQGARGSGGAGRGCGGPGPAQIDPQRFAISNITLYHLIVKAYGTWSEPMGGCIGVISTNLLSGGPDWTRSEQWDIQANMPAGIPSYTWLQLEAGKAPELQTLLQNLLTDRFKLVLQREMKEMPVYLLTVAKPSPKLMPSTGVGVRIRPGSMIMPGSIGERVGLDPNGQAYFQVNAYKVSMAQVASYLVGDQARPVLDRTGLTGDFDFDNVQYAVGDGFLRLMASQSGRPLGTAAPRASLALAFEEELGLKLEEAKEKIEVLVIKSAEKPSEN